MRTADFKARIRKIEITNRALSEGWQQSIRVILDDIDLTDENLLELRQFKPNENVFITIEAEQPQLTLFTGDAGSPGNSMEHEEEIENGFSEDDTEPGGIVARAWNY